MENWYQSVEKRILKILPKLRFTLEHISTGFGIDFVEHYHKMGFRVLGTITAHHLLLTLDDVIGGKLRPDHFCMPIPKTPEDKIENPS